ncbi:MAG: CDP-alcohol phosphatidyltransferase family protein [Polyangiaceae bacterium]|nr:CDP-alcohol phosphatidyltransferase family protein [Polyangiaceae bacterium]
MRPLAAVVVAALERSPVTPNQLTLLNLAIFLVAAALFVGAPSQAGGLAAVAVLELSYLFDCADGMLARLRKTASPTGHLFDFFTDEAKATLLAAAMGVRLYRTGGLGVDLAAWPAGDARFLLACVVEVVVVASAISLTNFVRRPELTGKETPTEAHYEANAPSTALGARLVRAPMALLQLLNHYPSHLWLWVALGRLDAYFWLYLALNSLYLARGWLGLVLRFGRS